MQAVILAAGMGKRLRELTEHKTKCMIEVNGISLIERALLILDQRNLSQMVIVVGFKSEKLIRFIETLRLKTPIIYINNEVYDKTNNIYSLLLAKEYMIQEDSLLLESDIIFEDAVIDLLLEDPRDTLALVDQFADWMDGTCVELDDTDSIVNFIPGKQLKYSEKVNYFKTVNIYKFGKNFSRNIYIPFLEAYFKAMGVNEYYESVIKLIAMIERPQIKAKRLDGQIWYEIDDIQDLDIAESLFAGSAEYKYKLITERYGGYWRYPNLIDFCYLVNPYYPSSRMMEEMVSNFEVLARTYPSGMRVNSLLASKCFDVRQENILVGNGAAELIKAVVERFKEGVTGIVIPSFDEYRHRISGEVKAYKSPRKDFSYTVIDLMQFFESNPVSRIILVNPDNPSGNYIPYSDMKRFIAWCKDKNIGLILDESFLDFADENTRLDRTALNREVLDSYKNLYVIKSISKSCGVPGIRLGILASSDMDTIAVLKKDVSIWNINSFGEYYLQIADKYKNDYLESLNKLRAARKNLIHDLAQIDYLAVFPSQANYIMCEVTDKTMRAEEIAVYLLQNNILVKDLTNKIDNDRHYIRIAVRNENDNARLVQTLRSLRSVR